MYAVIPRLFTSEHIAGKTRLSIVITSPLSDGFPSFAESANRSDADYTHAGKQRHLPYTFDAKISVFVPMMLEGHAKLRPHPCRLSSKTRNINRRALLGGCWHMISLILANLFILLLSACHSWYSNFQLSYPRLYPSLLPKDTKCYDGD